MAITPQRVSEIATITGFDRLNGYSSIITPMKFIAVIAEISKEFNLPVEEVKEYVKVQLAEAYSRTIMTLELPSINESIRKFQTGELRADLLEK